jgi:hypothetical protein
VNPDGAEVSMTTPYRSVGNGHYLPWEEQETGLHITDIIGYLPTNLTHRALAIERNLMED